MQNVRWPDLSWSVEMAYKSGQRIKRASISIMGIKVSAVGLELLLVLQMPEMAGIYEMTWRSGEGVGGTVISTVLFSFQQTVQSETGSYNTLNSNKKSKCHAEIVQDGNLKSCKIMCFLFIKSPN